MESQLYILLYLMKNLVTLALVPALTMGAIGLSSAQVPSADQAQTPTSGYEQQMQDHQGPHRGAPEQMKDVNVTMTKLDNGIQITQTSDNADTVAKLHDRADQHLIMTNSTRNVENIDNGIKMTITSDNADVISLLQNKDFPTPKDEKVTATKTNLDNGVEITLTSDDATVVQHLQAGKDGQRPPRGQFPGHRMPMNGEQNDANQQ